MERIDPQHIILKETASEYLLYIHATLKQRARQIEGRSWDAVRKCWVYPHTIQIYRSLIAEFGDALDDRTEAAKNKSGGHSNTRPMQLIENAPMQVIDRESQSITELETNDPRQTQLDELAEQTARLHRELRETRLERDTLANNLAMAQEETRRYRTQSTGQQVTPVVTQLRQRLSELEQQLAARSEINKRHIAELENLKSQLTKSQREVEQLKESKTVQISSAMVARALIKLAQATAEGNKQFTELIQNRQINAQLPMLLNGALVTALEKILPGVTSKDSLNDLLKAAREQNVLTNEQINLAHIIRTQRNVVAHVDIPQSAVTARALLTLFAAALLWPELPQTGKSDTKHS